ncbi:MAG: sigma 54-interacting transcriptional regulator [Myxococcota bacterium]
MTTPTPTTSERTGDARASGARASGVGVGVGIWVLHRDAARRDALAAACAGLGVDVRAASPSDALFADEASLRAVRVVVLGVPRDPEVELEFAHRSARRLPGRRFVLAADRHDERALATLFDALDAHRLGAGFDARALRAAVVDALRPPVARDSLRLRRHRDALSDRFARWLGDVDAPELLRAMDPQLAHVPIVVTGEPGTGRELLARYVHTFGGDAAGGRMPFVAIDCARARSARELAAAIAASGGAASATVFLADLDRLAPSLQTTLRGWIEYGLPPGLAAAARLRFVASLGPSSTARARALDPGLRAALAGLEIAIPPLRERPDAIEKIARATLAAQAHAAGRRPRELAPDALRALAVHGWPGNARELESAVVHALAETGADPIHASHLGLGAAHDVPASSAERARPQPAAPLEGVLVAGREDDERSLPEAEIVADEPPPRASAHAQGGAVTRASTRTREAAVTRAAATRDAVTRDGVTREREARDALDEAGAIVELSLDDLVDPPSAEARTQPAPASPPRRAERVAASPPAPKPDAGPTRAPRAPRAPHAQPTPSAARTAEVPTRAARGGDFDEERSWHRLLAATGDAIRRRVDEVRGALDALPAEPDAADAARVEARLREPLDALDAEAERLDALARTFDERVEAFDASALVESLLAELREAMTRGGLLVLKELDRRHPHASAQPGRLRVALRGVLARMGALAREGGELYVASHMNAAGLHGAPAVRLLLRATTSPARPAAAMHGALRVELAACEAAVRSARGAFTVSDGGGGQLLVVLDLPAARTAGDPGSRPEARAAAGPTAP